MNLYVLRYSGIFVSGHYDMEAHRQQLTVLFISPDALISLEKEDEHYLGKYIIIGPGELHRIEIEAPKAILIAFDRNSTTARALKKKYISENGIGIIAETLLEPLETELGLLMNDDCTIEEAGQIHDEIVNLLLHGNRHYKNEIDPRIALTLQHLQRLPDFSLTISDLSKMINLSPGRLSHLFTGQVGISLRHYLLWQKLTRAIQIIIQGKSFTEAAHEAGFSDSAHLSRTFRTVFGSNLLYFFKNYVNSRFIQVKTEKF